MKFSLAIYPLFFLYLSVLAMMKLNSLNDFGSLLFLPYACYLFYLGFSKKDFKHHISINCGILFVILILFIISMFIDCVIEGFKQNLIIDFSIIIFACIHLFFGMKYYSNPLED